MGIFTPISLAADVIYGVNLLTSSIQGDAVAIFDAESFEQVFSGARSLRANVRETSRVMDHPLETGVTISDHFIINPNEIEISALIPSVYYNSAYQDIKEAFLNKTLLSVQTKADVYTNMIVAEMPHEENPELFDVLVQGIRLKEIIYVAPTSITTINKTGQAPTVPSNYSPVNPKNANTLQRGQCTAKDPTGLGLTSPTKRQVNFWAGGAA